MVVIKVAVKNTKDDAYAYAEGLKQRGYSVTIEQAESIVIEAGDSVFANDDGVYVIIGKR